MLYKRKNKNKSKIWIVIALIVVVAIGVVVIYFVWLKNRSIESKEQVDLKSNKKEVKFIYKTFFEKDDNGYYVFDGVNPKKPRKDWRLFHINQNHPQIKELLKENKLQKDKKFTIRYGKVDEKTDDGLIYTFNENNTELKIIDL